jgi:hypothetical protein
MQATTCEPPSNDTKPINQIQSSPIQYYRRHAFYRRWTSNPGHSETTARRAALARITSPTLGLHPATVFEYVVSAVLSRVAQCRGRAAMPPMTRVEAGPRRSSMTSRVMLQSTRPHSDEKATFCVACILEIAIHQQNITSERQHATT